MALIDDKTRNDLKKKFESELTDDVEVLVFTQTINLDPSKEEYNSFTTDFIKELSEISPKIKMKSLSITDDLAKKYNIETSPTLMIGENKGYKIIYNGAPAGYEASGLIDTLTMVSREDSLLSKTQTDLLSKIDKEGKIQVFVTPSCPHCPKAVFLANKIAIASKGKITAECVDAQENMALSQAFNVSSVPQQVINKDKDSITIGIQPDSQFIQQVLKYTSSDYEKIIEELEAAKAKKRELVDTPDYPVEVTDDTFDKVVSKYENLVVDCWAEWCGPCKMVGPIVETLASDYSGKVTFGKLNTDENHAISEKFSINSIPTLLVFKNGEKIDEFVGALPRNMLEEKIKSAFGL